MASIEGTIELSFDEKSEISKVNMEGQPESNMYEYQEGIDLASYYLEGFRLRSDEKPTDFIFAQYANSK